MFKAIKAVLGAAKREVKNQEYKMVHEELKYDKNSPLVKNMLIKNFNIEGKTAIVLGGTGGVGMSVVKQLIDCKCKVIVIGRNKRKFDMLFQDQNKDISFIKWDPFEETDYTGMLKCIIDECQSFDIYINCMGFFTEKDRSNDWLNVEEKDLIDSFKSNFFVHYLIEKEIVKFFIKNDIKGHIVNVTSITGLHATYGMIPYGLSKAALIHFTKSLAIAVAKYGIVVNGIAPGPIATSMGGKYENDSIFNSNTPNMRIALPEEIASTIVFLASDMALNLNGEIIVSDGGETLRGHGE